jgi:hypothetical protein
MEMRIPYPQLGIEKWGVIAGMTRLGKELVSAASVS